MKVWDLATLKPLAAIPGGSDWPQALAISPDGRRIAVGRYDGSLAIHDAATGRLAVTARAVPEPPPAAKPDSSATPPSIPPRLAGPRGDEAPRDPDRDGRREGDHGRLRRAGPGRDDRPAREARREPARHRSGHRPRCPRRPASDRGHHPAGRPSPRPLRGLGAPRGGRGRAGRRPGRAQAHHAPEHLRGDDQSAGRYRPVPLRGQGGAAARLRPGGEVTGLEAQRPPDPARRSGPHAGRGHSHGGGARPGPDLHRPPRRDLRPARGRHRLRGIGEPFLPDRGGEPSPGHIGLPARRRARTDDVRPGARPEPEWGLERADAGRRRVSSRAR